MPWHGPQPKRFFEGLGLIAAKPIERNGSGVQRGDGPEDGAHFLSTKGTTLRSRSQAKPVAEGSGAPVECHMAKQITNRANRTPSPLRPTHKSAVTHVLSALMYRALNSHSGSSRHKSHQRKCRSVVSRLTGVPEGCHR